MIARNSILNIDIREKLLRLFRSTAHRKSLRLARQTESHHSSKIDEFFSSLLEQELTVNKAFEGRFI